MAGGRSPSRFPVPYGRGRAPALPFPSLLKKGGNILDSGIIVQFFQQIINGISLGSIYALIALGYTMVYGIMRLINFAHGDIYMLGAYVGFFVTTQLQLGFFPALICSMVVIGITGVLIEKLVYKPLRSSSKISILITAIGMSLFIEYTTMYFLTPQPRTFPPVLPNTIFHLGDIIVSFQQLVILGSTVVLMLLLWYIIQYTKMGKAMRAVSYDTDAALLMGINVDHVISFTFALGSALAGAAGVLVGIYYNTIDPLMGIMPGLKAFIAAVLGGIGIIPGAMMGGLILGVVEALVSGFISSTFRDAAAFGILIVILLIKPTGLLGKNETEKV